MKLFLCLALFSLSRAEPLFRRNLHQNVTDHHHLDQAHNVYKRDTGSDFRVSGDCRISPAGGDYYDVYSSSSGSCYLTYAGCSASTSSGGNRIRKIRDVHTQSAGSVYITYCSSSTSGPLAHVIYIESSGGVSLMNCCAPNCGKLAHDVYISSSGILSIMNCCGSSCEGLFDNVIKTSSGYCPQSGCCHLGGSCQ